MAESITNKNVATLWKIPLALGLLFVMLGIIMIKNPIGSFYSLSIIIGGILIISGVIEMYFFGKPKRRINNWGFYLSGGLIDLLIGIILITNPKLILIVLTLLVSLLLIYKAVLSIRIAIDLKNSKRKNWVWVLIPGVLILLFAIVLILKPQILGAAIAFWIAFSFIVFGLYRVYLAFQLKKVLKD